MKTFAIAALAGLAAANPAKFFPRGANSTATEGVVYTTEVVTAYTTYCPAPTEVVVGNKTHTVTKATTLTITDCPCTITKPVTTTTDCETGPVVQPTKTNTPGKPAEDECAKKCNMELAACKGKPNANQSTCISQYSQCLGYDWAAGNREYATACASKPGKPEQTGAKPPTGGCNGKDCDKPGKPQPTGGQQTQPPVVKPTGTNPPTVTGAAAAVKPVGVLAALAAVAML